MRNLYTMEVALKVDSEFHSRKFFDGERYECDNIFLVENHLANNHPIGYFPTVVFQGMNDEKYFSKKLW